MLDLSGRQWKMIDDERGPCGDGDVSKGMEGISMNEGDPQSQTQIA